MHLRAPPTLGKHHDHSSLLMGGRGCDGKIPLIQPLLPGDCSPLEVYRALRLLLAAGAIPTTARTAPVGTEDSASRARSDTADATSRGMPPMSRHVRTGMLSLPRGRPDRSSQRLGPLKLIRRSGGHGSTIRELHLPVAGSAGHVSLWVDDVRARVREHLYCAPKTRLRQA
jgi:hypothetical protein